MDFRLSDEQLEWQQYCRRFSEEVIRPVAAKHDREQSVPWEVIREARKWNLSGIEYIQKIDRIQRQMAKDQKEIDRLRAETREILARLEAA